jgi:DNA-3-methyladenine glycosylase I
MAERQLRRCPWAGDDPLYVAYHDEEWGVPEHDGRALFEMLVLDGFQAGLSWITILRKRESFRRAFDSFDPERMARFGSARIVRLLANPGIVRHRGKIEAAVANARAYLRILDEGVDFSRFLWDFVGGEPRQNRWHRRAGVPAETPESRAMSKALRQRGFTFVGPTVCYAVMQSAGLVNDHLTSCFRHRELGERDPSAGMGRNRARAT